MTRQFKMPLRWLAGFGAGIVTAFVLVCPLPLKKPGGVDYAGFLLYCFGMPAAGALGAAALVSGRLPLRRMVRTVAGFFIGILAAHILLIILEEYVLDRVLDWADRSIPMMALFIVCVALAGAICGLSIRPRLAIPGAHAFASGGALGVIVLYIPGITGLCYGDYMRDSNFMQLLSAFITAYAAGGALLAWRYAMHGTDGRQEQALPVEDAGPVITPLRSAVHGMAAFGIGYFIIALAAFLLSSRPAPDAGVLMIVMPLAGAAGALAFFAPRLPPARTLSAAAGFALGFGWFTWIACILEREGFFDASPNSLVKFLVCWLACVGVFLLGGATGAFSVRPALAVTGARAFAAGGVACGLTSFAVTMYEVRTSYDFYLVVFVGLLTGFATGGAFFGYWYQKRKIEDARNDNDPSGEGTP